MFWECECHTIEFNANKLSSSVYFYVLQTDEFIDSKK